MSLAPSSLTTPDTNAGGSTCCGGGRASCHPTPTRPGFVTHYVPIKEETLFDVRSRADYLKSVYACTKDQLSPQAFSDLAERWNELTETALVIDASLAAGTEQEYVEMKTSPLDTAKYVGKEDKKVVDWHHAKLQRLRNGIFIPDIEELVRSSQNPNWSVEDTHAFNDIASRHLDYFTHVQDLADTENPEEYCDWAGPVCRSEVQRSKMDTIIALEAELEEDFKSLKSKTTRPNRTSKL